MSNKQKQEKLVDDLLSGKAILYSMSDIQKKLSISRSTLNRWIKNGENRISTLLEVTNYLSHDFGKLSSLSDDDEEDTTTVFPQPDLYIGNSPRWSRETVKNWLSKQVYISLGYFLTACASMGIDSTPMEGIDNQEYNKILNLNQYHTLFAVAIGYRNPEDANQPSIKSKNRLPLEKIIG